jgi:hypothetical protein
MEQTGNNRHGHAVTVGRIAGARDRAVSELEADPGPGDAALTLSRSELAEAWRIRG